MPITLGWEPSKGTSLPWAEPLAQGTHQGYIIVCCRKERPQREAHWFKQGQISSPVQRTPGGLDIIHMPDKQSISEHPLKTWATSQRHGEVPGVGCFRGGLSVSVTEPFSGHSFHLSISSGPGFVLTIVRNKWDYIPHNSNHRGKQCYGPHFTNDRMRHNNWFWLKVGGQSQRMPHSLALLFYKWVNLETQRGWGFAQGHKSNCWQSQRNSRILLLSSKLFSLLSATSQLEARVRGLPGPAFLRSPRSTNPLLLLLHPSNSTALSDLFLETIKNRVGLKLQLYPPTKIPITFIRNTEDEASRMWQRRTSRSLEVFLN